MLKRILPGDMVAFVIAIWVVFLANTILIGFDLNQFGIYPRDLSRWYGIFLAPFLHAGLFHLLSNTLPLLVLGTLLKISVGTVKLRFIMILGSLGSGLGVWCFGSSGVAVGASGLVFSLLGFMFSDAIFNPSLRNWLVAIVVFLSYGGALLSLLSFLPHISWAAHFWGFATGIALSILFKPKREY